MVLHTIISEYDLFYQPDERPRSSRRQGKALLTGESRPEGLCVERIISTDPQDFLRYSPGMVLPPER